MVAVGIEHLSVLFKDLQSTQKKQISQGFLQKLISKAQVGYPPRGHHHNINCLSFSIFMYVCILACVCVCVSVDAHTLVCVHACRGLRFTSGIIHCFSSMFIEADMPVLLISLLSLFWGSSISAF